MAAEIVMPNLGFDAERARLVEWLKHPGDSISRGEAVALVESDKATVELESIATGIMLEQRFSHDSMVPVGAVVALIEEGHEDRTTAKPSARSDASDAVPANAKAPTATPTQAASPTSSMTPESASAPTQVAPPESASIPIRALPRTRKLARAHGIDLASVSPRRKDGVRTDKDVLDAAAGRPAPVIPGSAQPLTRRRQALADRLAGSMREAPHFYVAGEIDLEAALQRLPREVRINDLILYTTVRALQRVPQLNATFDGALYHRSPAVNLCIAVASPDGVLTPVLSGAEQLSLQDMGHAASGLAQRARQGRLSAGDLAPGTFTVSNLGMMPQVDHFTAVINPPQVAILAAGAVKPRPVVRNGDLHVRHTINLTAGGDHRVLDGMDLARFLAEFQAAVDSFPEGENQ